MAPITPTPNASLPEAVACESPPISQASSSDQAICEAPREILESRTSAPNAATTTAAKLPPAPPLGSVSLRPEPIGTCPVASPLLRAERAPPLRLGAEDWRAAPELPAIMAPDDHHPSVSPGYVAEPGPELGERVKADLEGLGWSWLSTPAALRNTQDPRAMSRAIQDGVTAWGLVASAAPHHPLPVFRTGQAPQAQPLRTQKTFADGPRRITVEVLGVVDPPPGAKVVEATFADSPMGEAPPSPRRAPMTRAEPEPTPPAISSPEANTFKNGFLPTRAKPDDFLRIPDAPPYPVAAIEDDSKKDFGPVGGASTFTGLEALSVDELAGRILSNASKKSRADAFGELCRRALSATHENDPALVALQSLSLEVARVVALALAAGGDPTALERVAAVAANPKIPQPLRHLAIEALSGSGDKPVGDYGRTAASVVRDLVAEAVTPADRVRAIELAAAQNPFPLQTMLTRLAGAELDEAVGRAALTAIHQNLDRCRPQLEQIVDDVAMPQGLRALSRSILDDADAATKVEQLSMGQLLHHFWRGHSQRTSARAFAELCRRARIARDLRDDALTALHDIAQAAHLPLETSREAVATLARTDTQVAKYALFSFLNKVAWETGANLPSARPEVVAAIFETLGARTDINALHILVACAANYNYPETMRRLAIEAIARSKTETWADEVLKLTYLARSPEERLVAIALAAKQEPFPLEVLLTAIFDANDAGLPQIGQAALAAVMVYARKHPAELQNLAKNAVSIEQRVVAREVIEMLKRSN